MNIFRSIIVVGWILWLLYWLFSAFGVKRNVNNYNWRTNIMLRVVIVLLVFLFLHIPVLYHFILNIHTRSFYKNPFINVFGVIIFLLGFILSMWARICLGKNWGMPMSVKEKPELVTKGPYAYVRHPIYTGMIFAMLGTTLVVTIFWLIPFIILSAYFIYSLKIEEREMLKQFPKDYMAYKRRTKALIPFVY